ncbi:MAG: sugar phosphate isomerase/epimerase family protein [Isosphaeraceae bacterium]
MRLGYNTNGLPHHRLGDALSLLAEEGYRSVAITLDAGALDPYAAPGRLAEDLRQTQEQLERLGLACVIETGARFLLNPRRKHDPTLMDPDPARRATRVDFLLRAIDIAAGLRAEAVSLWSGALPDAVEEGEALDRLAFALDPVLERAAEQSVPLAFEPEPGMFIDTMERFARLDERVGHPMFDLTIDLGHIHCLGDGEIADQVRAWGPRIRNIHAEDMVRGVHDHLPFGEGTIDFPPIFRALHEVGYTGGIHVELSRHGHDAVTAVRRSASFLRPLIDAPGPRG